MDQAVLISGQNGTLDGVAVHHDALIVTLLHGEIDVAQHLVGAEALGQVLDL